MAARLAFLTGMLGRTTWLVLSGFFSANITGDLVESASYLVPGRTPKVEQLQSRQFRPICFTAP